MNFLKKQNSVILFFVALIATLEVCNTFRIAKAVDMIENFEPVVIETVPETTVEETTEFQFKIDVPLDDNTQVMIYEKCVEHDLEFPFVMALIFKESSFRPDAVSSDGGDYGLMQINKSNHQWLSEELGITNFLDPEQNVIAGLYILKDYFEKYECPSKVLMAYNMGEPTAKQLWKQGVYSTDYAENIIQLAGEYKKEIEERMGENDQM